MKKYIKRPVEVETVKWNGMNYDELFSFCGDKIAFEFSHPYIKTLEGIMNVSKGDYIIKGVEGEFYPCKPDIFHKTYQPVDELGKGD